MMRLFGLLLMLAASACSLFQPEDRFGARPVAFASLNGWEQDNHAEALKVFLASCPKLVKKPQGLLPGSNIDVPQQVWQSLCGDAARATDARQFFEQRFSAYRVNNNGRERGLFTGYYEPLLYGSHHRGDDFLYPVYALPPDVKEDVPYFSRAEIDNGALTGKKLELMWVDDPAMLFFLQVQGSGRVKFADGKEARVGYAGKNGHKYVSLGKVMIDEGIMPKEEVNFFSIRHWLYKNRDRAFAMMQKNPSYVFFRTLEGPGPIGGSGAALTPLRSLAVDKKYIPYGLPVYLETTLPDGATFNRLMVAQDTGGAIKGPVRGDIFFGAGDDAEYYAGNMKGEGGYTLLIPKEVVAVWQSAP